VGKKDLTKLAISCGLVTQQGSYDETAVVEFRLYIHVRRLNLLRNIYEFVMYTAFPSHESGQAGKQSVSK